MTANTPAFIADIVAQLHRANHAPIHAPANPAPQLRQDSRAIQAGDVFVAFSGDVHDGRSHIATAIQAGASAVLAEAQGLAAFVDVANTANNPLNNVLNNPLNNPPNKALNAAPIIAVENLKQALGAIADAYYQHPSSQLDMLAITGTNGKTTVVNYLAQLLQALQHKPCAVLGTIGAGLYGAAKTTGLTTPHASQVHAVLAQALADGAGSAAIEASSIGVQEGRLNGVAFKVAAFTNLTQDHLDYHGTMAAYGAAKRALFDWPGLQAAVINIDDAFGVELLEYLQRMRPTVQRITTSIRSVSNTAGLFASDMRILPNGSQAFTVHYAGKAYPASLPALGAFNIQNSLTVLGCVLALGYDCGAAVAVLSGLQGVAGRMQRIEGVSTTPTPTPLVPLVLVDYAHTPDGLMQALQALRPVAQARQGRLHVVFGCGGNRDAGKRPLMGAIAQQYADVVTITNDNPRHENPADIAAQIAAAAPTARLELDRATAIAHAIQSAAPNDIVLLAGKGHETTQTIGEQVLPFSDAQHAQAALRTCL
jgi:UDP-N-acetylmuramoyl-L-alanyl-D-glutamate--2,6-diaminopimelate ligase